MRVEDFEGFLRVGTDRTDRRGNWSVRHSTGPDGGVQYLLIIEQKKIKTQREIIVCKQRVQGFKGF